MPTKLHQALTIPGPAGQLEAILWFAPEQERVSPPPLAAVVCHPHPLFGGAMHNKVVYHTAKTIHGFGLPVARFNFRGVGRSEGTHDNGEGEVSDVLAVLDFLGGKYPRVPLLVAGFSFGAWVGSRAGCGDPRVAELICLGLPIGGPEPRNFSHLKTCDKPRLFASGEFDRFCPAAQLRSMVETFPPQIQENTQVRIIRGGDHFFTGHLPELDNAIAEWLQERHLDLAPRES